jgi:hypothetical protein
MKSTPAIMSQAICSQGTYAFEYRALFGSFPKVEAGPLGGFCPLGGEHEPTTVFDNVGLALDAYTRRLQSVNSKLISTFAAGSRATTPRNIHSQMTRSAASRCSSARRCASSVIGVRCFRT